MLIEVIYVSATREKGEMLKTDDCGAVGTVLLQIRKDAKTQ